MAVRGKLNANIIISAATDMLDTGGETGFSMRKLATELGVDPMAIYHHHASKSALIHAVLDAMLRDWDLPEPSADWRHDLRALCKGLRALARKHPGTFRLYQTYDQWLPAQYHILEECHATLMRSGLSERHVVQAARVVIAYSEAFAVEEIKGWVDPAYTPAMDQDWREGPYPTLSRLVREIGRTDPDADFTFGLDVLISGMEAKIA